MSSNYLSHHGVLGMRWGTRKAYNKYTKLNDQYKHAKKTKASKSVISSLNVEKQKAAAKYATKQSHDINISRVNSNAYFNKDYKTGKQKHAEDIKKWKRAQQYGEQKLREVLNENRNVQITGIRYRSISAKVDKGQNALRRLGGVAMAAAIGVGVSHSKKYTTVQNKYKYVE